MVAAQVIDLVRAVLVIGSGLASLRARYARGIVVAVGAMLLMVAEVFLVFRYPVEPLPLPLAIASVIFGPSALPNAAPLFGAEHLGDPLHHIVPAALLGLAAHGAFARSRELHPDSEPARHFDRAGLRFLGAGVMHTLMALSGVLGRLLIADV